jgi:myo-inositol-1(or 4)-monophosphatase
MIETSSNDLDNLLFVATQSALQAGALLHQKWGQPRQVSQKGFRDLVTDADHASQALIVEMIQSVFPSHGFLVEEKVADLSSSGPIIWIIDPVDGTTNYSRQQPNYCISIAAVKRPSPQSSNQEEPEILAGVIYDPMHDELFQASLGQGAYLNGSKIAVSDTDNLGEAVIALDWSHDPDQRQRTLDMLQRIAHEVQTIRAVGSAALTLAWVAAGRLDAYFNLNLKPWDVAAGKLLISEAGGKLVNLDNRPWFMGNASCIAGNGRVAPNPIVKLMLDQ